MVAAAPLALATAPPSAVLGVETGAGGSTVAAFGRRTVNHAAMKMTAPARRMRTGGEIWLTTLWIGRVPRRLERTGV